MTDAQMITLGGFIAFIFIGNYLLAFAYVVVATFVCPAEYLGYLFMTVAGITLLNKFRSK